LDEAGIRGGALFVGMAKWGGRRGAFLLPDRQTGEAMGVRCTRASRH